MRSLSANGNGMQGSNHRVKRDPVDRSTASLQILNVGRIGVDADRMLTGSYQVSDLTRPDSELWFLLREPLEKLQALFLSSDF